MLPCGVGDAEILGETGDGDGCEAAVRAGLGGKGAEDALGFGSGAGTIFGDGLHKSIDFGVAGVVEEGAVGGIGKKS